MVRKIARFFSSVALVGVCPQVRGQAVVEWDGGGNNNNWTTGANWVGDAVPGTGDIARFQTDTARDPRIASGVSVEIGRLEFLSGTDAEAFASTGTLTIHGVSGSGIVNTSGQAHTFAPHLAIGGSQSWSTSGAGSNLSFNRPIDLGSHTLTVDAGAGTTVAVSTGSGDVVSGTGGFVKNGAGTLTFGNVANTFSGGVTLNAGTTTFINAGAFGTGTITLAGGTLQYANLAGSRTLTNDLAVTASSTIAGAGTTNQIYSSNTISGSGALTIDNTTDADLFTVGFSGAGLAFSGDVAFADGLSELRLLNASGTQTFSGDISGASVVRRNALGGTTVLSGNNTHSGGTIVQAGTLELGSATALGSGALTLDGGTLYSAASRTIANEVVVDGISTVAGAAGVDYVFTSNAIGGTAGNLTFDNTSDSGTMSVAFSGDGFTLTRSIALTDAFTELRLQNATGTQTFSNPISGDGRVIRDVAGGATVLSNNSFTGGLTLSAGTIAANSNNALGTGTFTFAGGEISAINSGRNLPNAVELVGDGTVGGALNLTLSGGVTQSGGNRTLSVTNTGQTTIATNALTLAETNQARTLTLDVDAGSGGLVISSVIQDGAGSGADGLVKNGGGTLTLSGPNTYTGTTTLNAGAVVVGNDAAFGTGTLVLNGASLSATSDRTLANDLDGSASTALSGTSGVDFVFSSNAIAANGGSLSLANSSGTGLTTLGFSGTGFDFTGGIAFADANTELRFLNTSGTQTFSGVISGGGAVRQDGAGGTVILSATNTYTGATDIDAGTLRLGAAGDASHSPLGATTSGTTVSSGATLDLNGFSIVAAEALTISGAGAGGLGALLNSSGTAAFAGDITLVSATSFGGSGDLTLSGAIGGTSALTKLGTGTLTLSGTSTFTNTVNVTEGVLRLGAAGDATNTPLGTSSGGIEVSSGAAFDLGGFTLGTSETLGISGTGVGGSGALTNSGGAATLSGGIDLDSDASIGGAGDIALSGQISGANVLTKVGANTLTLSNSANNYTGATAVDAGTLAVTANNALGTTAAGTSVASGSTLDFRNVAYSTAEALAIAGGTLAASTGTSSFAGDVALGTGGATVNVGGTALSLSGQLSGSTTLTKSGTGSLSLSGDSGSYTGPVEITSGTVTISHNNALGTGTAGTTVYSGATLALQGGLTAAGNGTLTLSGTGDGGIGALHNVSGDNMWAHDIALAADTTISGGTDPLNTFSQVLRLGAASPFYDRGADPFHNGPTDSSTLSLSGHTLTLTADATQVRVNARVTGTGDLVVNAANNGLVNLAANMNTFTGTTYVNDGTLWIRSTYNTYPNDPVNPNYFGLNGPLVIGDGSGSALSAVVNLRSGTLGQEVLNFTTDVTLNRDGRLFAQSAQSIDELIFNGGTVDVSTAGTLFLNNTVTVNATAGETATIVGTDGTQGTGGTLSLTIHNGDPSTTDRVFNVVGGVGNTSDLTISAIINNGSFTKEGAGTMTILSNNLNGYGGTTTINNGIVNIQHNNALGLGGGLDAKGTIVNSGGTLQLDNGGGSDLTIASEKLFLNGTGFGGNGALQNVAGNNTWAGVIDLQSNARVQNDADLLTLSGNIISSTNATLNVGGAADTTISGSIGTGNGGITKDGAGTLVLSGTSTFHGETVINQGIVNLQSNAGLGSSSGATTVTSGTVLQLNGGIATNDALNLSGTGIGGTGALRGLNSNNTAAGLVTLQADTLVTADSGTTLTLSGTASGGAGALQSTGHNLTIGTAAQNGNVTISGGIDSTGTLTKEGSGNLTFADPSGLVTGTVGDVFLNNGTMNVGNGSQVAVLETGAFSSEVGTTLTIASGASVTADYATGTTTYFSGAMAGAGEFAKSGDGTLVFDNTFTASNLTLELAGGTLSLLGGQFTFGTIHITGDTILDFNNSAGTFLSSAALVIEAGVTVTVNNWVSVANNTAQSTVWYATSTVNSGTLGGTDNVGGTPLNQIVFTNYNGLTTTWVSGNHDGWFDHEIRPTPEPSTYGALLLSGCLGLLGWKRLRSRRDGATGAQ